jgi:hypothetical protein
VAGLLVGILDVRAGWHGEVADKRNGSDGLNVINLADQRPVDVAGLQDQLLLEAGDNLVIFHIDESDLSPDSR